MASIASTLGVGSGIDIKSLVDGLTQAILKLAESPALRESLGVQARRRIETDFDWDRKVETVFSIYEKALGSQR